MGRTSPGSLPGVKKTRELLSAPLEDEVEVTLLGPGYGESIVVHVGDGGWIIVDSCIDDSGNPQALDYLLSMGIDPAEAVELVVATHWHDDHIRGMNELVDACRKADFCCAGAFRHQEFLAAVHTLGGRGSFAGGSGVGELQRVFATLVEQGRIPNFVRADVRIRTTRTCEIWSLSPHNSEFMRFLKAIAPLFPKEGDTKTRIPDVSPNNVAVVLWIRVGEIVILLGADLEANGWVKIVGSRGRPQMRGTAFKVPHHGGASAHEPSVWRAMLEDDPLYSHHGDWRDAHCRRGRICCASCRRPDMPMRQRIQPGRIGHGGEECRPSSEPYVSPTSSCEAADHIQEGFACGGE